MRSSQLHHRLRQTIVGLVMCAMLAQSGWNEVPCCCHDQHDAVRSSSIDPCASQDECVEAGNSKASCTDSCCHVGSDNRQTEPTISGVLSESHRSAPHRCCRDYCQPVSSGGDESCTCEFETSTLAILTSSRGDVTPVFVVARLEASVDSSRLKLPRVRTRPGECLTDVRSPGRVQSILFDRWLI